MVFTCIIQKWHFMIHGYKWNHHRNKTAKNSLADQTMIANIAAATSSNNWNDRCGQSWMDVCWSLGMFTYQAARYHMLSYLSAVMTCSKLKKQLIWTKNGIWTLNKAWIACILSIIKPSEWQPGRANCWFSSAASTNWWHLWSIHRIHQLFWGAPLAHEPGKFPTKLRRIFCNGLVVWGCSHWWM